ncbi:MAG: DUF2071 domain-containing protein [Blastocatellia bacterium]|nr:DUF2071 domain-containing protein [Blastocatellia bacterium]
MAMKLAEAIEENKSSVFESSEAAKRRLSETEGRPLFLADWLRAVFIHYEVEAAVLQREVPFELDLLNGRAYISIVAFTQRNLRPRIGGRVAAWALAPIATHAFLNLRTYVRCNGEPGIYFLAEWVPNRFSVLLGPPVYGLPYRLGRLDYRHDHEDGRLFGEVAAGDSSARLIYQAGMETRAHNKCIHSWANEFKHCRANSIDEFLMERYSAFTKRGSKVRRFRVWHEPWLQTEIDVTIASDSLLSMSCRWFEHARLTGANYSPGVRDVWIGRPQRLRSPVRG